MQKENNFFFSFSSESKLTKGSKLLNYCRTCKKVAIKFGNFIFSSYLCTRFQDRSTLGEMVEWSITVVLKTTVPRGTGGSNPSLSAQDEQSERVALFVFRRDRASHPRSGVLSVASLCESGFADYESLSLRTR